MTNRQLGCLSILLFVVLCGSVVVNGLGTVSGGTIDSSASAGRAGGQLLVSFSGQVVLGNWVNETLLGGGEVEGRYSAPGITIGLNQAYVKQIDWRLAADQTGSGISYSDFNRNVDTMANVVLHGVGNDLNNVPLAVTKLYAS